MRIAICGTRGIPAAYGGFETFAEQLATRLVQKGYEVTVYARSHFVAPLPGGVYREVRVVRLPSVKSKYLETPVHTLLSILHLLLHPVDVVLVCNAANSPFIWLLRLFRIPVAVNVDGIERRRAKWNALGRGWYRLGERCSVWFSNRIVADADVIAKYYERNYGVRCAVIRYGYNDGQEGRTAERLREMLHLSPSPSAPALFRELGIDSQRYILYVSRLEPENHAHTVLEAYELLSERSMPLVIVGDAPYAKAYVRRLRERAGRQVIFAGYRFGAAYEELQLGAFLYIQATEVGGTHPALVEAMGFGNCVVANDTPENREVLGDSGIYYERNDAVDLSRKLEMLLRAPERTIEYGRAARRRAVQLYSWEGIVRDYEDLFRSLVGVAQEEKLLKSA